MPFDEAVRHVHQLEAPSSPGKRALTLSGMDPRKRSDEAIAELSAVFLDRGAAAWGAPGRNQGFLHFFASLEGLGWARWRRHARKTARRVLAAEPGPEQSLALAEEIVTENLLCFGVAPDDRVSTIRAMLMEMRGWAGMFHRMEGYAHEAPANTLVRLVDFFAVQTILSRASIETLAVRAGWDRRTPLAHWLGKAPAVPSFVDAAAAPERHPSSLAFLDQSSDRRETLELEFEWSLLHRLGNRPVPSPPPRPSLQLFTCIDERSGSLRRHVEVLFGEGVDTHGIPGFFGLPILFQAASGLPPTVLAPDGVAPRALLVETVRTNGGGVAKSAATHMAQVLFAQAAQLVEKMSFSPIGSLLLSCLLPFSLGRLVLMSALPDAHGQLTALLRRTVLAAPRTDFKMTLEPTTAAAMLVPIFNNLGLRDAHHFAPLCVVLGHGSTSANNPFSAAYNCGACSGRPGGPNARFFARVANDEAVRARLRSDHGVCVPDDTVFVGGQHDTTVDTVELFDLDRVPASHGSRLATVRDVLDRALGLNALERCDRFASARGVRTPEQALRHVWTRACDPAEVRPELNHSTSAAVVVGRRGLTAGLSLNRRVFLPSYNPLFDTDEGTNLERVMDPALHVCCGIGLEYLFSTVSPNHHGAGTKVPLNIVGDIGVLQGTAGDLRAGLPAQMTEQHVPLRTLFIVDAPVLRIQAVLRRREDLNRLVRNEWVRLVARDPQTNRFFRYSRGEYVPIDLAKDAAPTERAYDMTAAGEDFFARQREHMQGVTRREELVYRAASAGMLMSLVVPLGIFGGGAGIEEATTSARDVLAAGCGTGLSLSALAFGRRFVHGDALFTRFALLSVGLAASFNMVALAPALTTPALAGWSMFGFSSALLINLYNDRPSVCNNATYAFAAYQVSDLAMLVAAALCTHHAAGAAITGGGGEHGALVANGLVVAALLKSSQLPLTSLFVRSMEGPTPASALGYAGLSAHVGVVLLASSMPLWFEVDAARAVLVSVGLATAVYSSATARVHADRKGSLAKATSATLGVIYAILGMGYADEALLLSLGHASFRMIQILRAPSIMADRRNLRQVLGSRIEPNIASQRVYRLGWALHRFHTDFHALGVLAVITRHVRPAKPLVMTRNQRWATTAGVLCLTGAPIFPLYYFKEHLLMELLHTEPLLAVAAMAMHFGLSVGLVRFLFCNVTNLSYAGDRKPCGRST